MDENTKQYLETQTFVFARFNEEFPCKSSACPEPWFQKGDVVCLYDNKKLRLNDTQFDGWQILHKPNGNGISIQAERLLQYDAVSMITDTSEVPPDTIQESIECIEGWLVLVQNQSNALKTKSAYMQGIVDTISGTVQKLKG